MIFPRRCPVCEDIVWGRSICSDCLKKISFVKSPVCMRCGRQISDDASELCDACMADDTADIAFEYGLCLMNYDELARRMMAQIKYHNKREYAIAMGRVLGVRYKDRIKDMKADCLVPIPVHKKRLATRGFNQATILAGAISEECHVPVREDIIKRVKETKAQKELGPTARLANLSKAFAVPENVSVPKTIILVDDIYTTGSTIKACSLLLRDRGVEHIYFLNVCGPAGE